MNHAFDYCKTPRRVTKRELVNALHNYAKECGFSLRGVGEERILMILKEVDTKTAQQNPQRLPKKNKKWKKKQQQPKSNPLRSRVESAFLICRRSNYEMWAVIELRNTLSKMIDSPPIPVQEGNFTKQGDRLVYNPF